MKTIIIGAGEVGLALREVLSGYRPDLYDTTFPSQPEGEYDYMHITFPYSERFEEYVKAYQEKYRPKYTVVHSTVPVGTSERLGALHSPIRGLHPNLARGIRTFPKFIGGSAASEVADYFRRVGLKVALFDKSGTTEAMKLYDTEYYKVCIDFAKRVKTFCNKNGLNFHEVYTLANQTYNEGYTALGYPEYVRPVLQPIMTPTGGHCVEPNHTLISKQEV